jgi:hypothetical protein
MLRSLFLVRIRKEFCLSIYYLPRRPIRQTINHSGDVSATYCAPSNYTTLIKTTLSFHTPFYLLL